MLATVYISKVNKAVHKYQRFSVDSAAAVVRWSSGESVGLLIMGSQVPIRLVHLLTSFVS